MGPNTVEAVKQWQSAHGLVSDGLVGPKTKAVMNAL
jgi:peptidoglycan hydrolase-like protein with peptidoglycan-binding domain